MNDFAQRCIKYPNCPCGWFEVIEGCGRDDKGSLYIPLSPVHLIDHGEMDRNTAAELADSFNRHSFTCAECQTKVFRAIDTSEILCAVCQWLSDPGLTDDDRQRIREQLSRR